LTIFSVITVILPDANELCPSASCDSVGHTAALRSLTYFVYYVTMTQNSFIFNIIMYITENRKPLCFIRNAEVF
jgi:hypothetical protein